MDSVKKDGDSCSKTAVLLVRRGGGSARVAPMVVLALVPFPFLVSWKLSPGGEKAEVSSRTPQSCVTGMGSSFRFNQVLVNTSYSSGRAFMPTGGGGGRPSFPVPALDFDVSFYLFRSPSAALPRFLWGGELSEAGHVRVTTATRSAESLRRLGVRGHSARAGEPQT